VTASIALHVALMTSARWAESLHELQDRLWINTADRCDINSAVDPGPIFPVDGSKKAHSMAKIGESEFQHANI
jgi:hypothetical protein